MTPAIATPPAPPERLPPPTARAAMPTAAADTIDTYISAIRARMRLVVTLPFVLAAIALSISLLRPRSYTARAAFVASEPNSASGTLGALSSIASQLGIPALSAVASSNASGSAQFYGDLLTSQAVLHAVIMEKYDATTPGDYGGKPFSGDLLEYFDPTGKTPADREVAAIKTLVRSNLVVAVDRPTGIVRLSVRTKNRLLSGLIARRLLDLVNDFNLRRRQTQAGAERDFDARRMQASLDSLRAAEANLADFRAANIDFSRSPKLGTREAELQRRVTLAQQIYTTVAQRYELANIEAVRNTPVITVLDSPEGLVEAQPRYTALITVGAFALGLVIACAIAFNAERRTVGARAIATR